MLLLALELILEFFPMQVKSGGPRPPARNQSSDRCFPRSSTNVGIAFYPSLLGLGVVVVVLSSNLPFQGASFFLSHKGVCVSSGRALDRSNTVSATEWEPQQGCVALRKDVCGSPPAVTGRYHLHIKQIFKISHAANNQKLASQMSLLQSNSRDLNVPLGVHIWIGVV